jgi:hypothetical protein
MEIEIVNSITPSQGETFDIRVKHEDRTVAEISLTMEQAADVAEYIRKAIEAKYFVKAYSRKPETLGEMEAKDDMVFANPAVTRPPVSQSRINELARLRKAGKIQPSAIRSELNNSEWAEYRAALTKL